MKEKGVEINGLVTDPVAVRGEALRNPGKKKWYKPWKDRMRCGEREQVVDFRYLRGWHPC